MRVKMYRMAAASNTAVTSGYMSDLYPGQHMSVSQRKRKIKPMFNCIYGFYQHEFLLFKLKMQPT